MDCRYAIPTAGLYLCTNADYAEHDQHSSPITIQPCNAVMFRLLHKTWPRSPAGFIIAIDMRKLLPGAVDYDKAAGGIISCDTDVTVGWQNGTRVLQRQQRSGK